MNKLSRYPAAILALLLLAVAGCPMGPDTEKMAAETRGMVFVKGGCYRMGDTFADGESDEKPVHEVCVDDFYIGKYEVTQREWKEVMGDSPSGFKKCLDCPVEKVSWYDVRGFIRRLNATTGAGYRLPTEAEWEYAAREGGKKVRFGTGKDTIGPVDANFNATVKYSKPYSRAGGHRKKTLPVRSFEPNASGLYGMSGNVYEWCSDWYEKSYYGKSPRDNPKGPDNGKGKVLRGGSWVNGPRDLRASNRYWFKPTLRVNNNGFRLAFSARE
jgi:formylglycine-generating enzyme required for sulfatase activity